MFMLHSYYCETVMLLQTMDTFSSLGHTLFLLSGQRRLVSSVPFFVIAAAAAFLS